VTLKYEEELFVCNFLLLLFKSSTKPFHMKTDEKTVETQGSEDKGFTTISTIVLTAGVLFLIFVAIFYGQS